MREKYRLRRTFTAACAAIVCCSGLSALAGGYVNAVTNTPGLRHFWMLDEPGTPAVSTDIVGGKTATHYNGFPPSTVGGGPTSTDGPKPSDGFSGMAVDNAALLYTSEGKTRSFVSNPDQLGTKSFAAGDMHGLSTEFWFKRSSINSEGVILGYNDTAGSRYGFTAITSTDTNTSIREIRVYSKDMAERQTVYQLGATPDLQWHHMAMTWDGGNLRTYLDGKEPAASVAFCASGAASGPIHQMDELVFGGDASTMDIRYNNGALDKIAIYDRPLTDAQVARHYEAAVTGIYKTPHYEQTVMNLNPCHYWRMEETHGRILDSVGDWSLTLTTTMNWASTGLRPPEYLGLETNNYAIGLVRSNLHGLFNTNALADALTPTNRFSDNTVTALTMSVWYRLSPTSPTGTRQIIAGFQRKTGTRYSFLVCRENSNNLRVLLMDSDEDQHSVYPYLNMTDSAWHHIVMTWDGTTMRTYLDGGNEKSYYNVNVAGALRTSDGFYLGMDAQISNFFDGEIDEAVLFNYALTAKQVEDLHKAAVRGKIPQGTVMRMCNLTNQGATTMPDKGICAHRGAMDTHPENTLTAFREAGVKFPLVDFLAPMVEAARQMGIEPLLPEYREPKLADACDNKTPLVGQPQTGG